MDDDARLQAVLRPGELLLWRGRPDPGLWFAAEDLYLIPIGCLVAIVWTVAASRGAGGPFVAALGIAVGLYMVPVRLFHKHYRKKRTVYGITTQRVLVAVGARPVVYAAWPHQPVTIRRSRDGTHASVILEATGVTAVALALGGWGRRSSRGNLGLEWGLIPKLAFFDVADADAMLAALDQAGGRSDESSTRLSGG